jgi:dihydroflavonol-4-reductase
VRALVTGAGGFIGAHVAQALLDAGWDVRGLDRDTTHVPEGAERVTGDITDVRVDGCDAVFHLAAVYSYARGDAARMIEVNVEGTRAVLAAARAAGVGRVVHTSSCATCGPAPGRLADERDHPPAWELKVAYKQSKLRSEEVALRAAAGGQDVVIVNPTTPVGPGDRRPTPTGKMIRDAAAGRMRAYVATTGLNVVDVRDCARGHLLAFEHGRAGERYLLGGENLALRDVFAIVATAAGRRPPRAAIPWALAYAAARASAIAMRPVGREPKLLVLDAVRVARLPMTFDDAKARRELGHSSQPAAQALQRAARAALRPML